MIESRLRIGTLIHGTYRVEDYLSSGGFGNTYVVRNVEFDEVYALKEFYIKGVCQRDGASISISVSNAENKECFAQQREKFKKEARRIRSLNNEHIVKVHDLFEENGTAYYVMDLVDGESLKDRLKRTNQALTEAEVNNLLPQILNGLKTIHNQGIWHLDIKPANIMVDKHGIVKLIDFGASKQQSSAGGATTSAGICYTMGYAPGEQMAQTYEDFGPWTDFYALGATLYKLLTLQDPPSVTKVSDDETEDKHEALPMQGLSDKTRQLVIWMMQDIIKKRPQNVNEILKYLLNVDNFDESIPLSLNTNQESTILMTSQTLSKVDNGDMTILKSDYERNKEDVIAFFVNGVSFNMVKVETGSFMMDTLEDFGKPVVCTGQFKLPHKVTISNAYYIGETVVTQELWIAIMGNNPSYFRNDKKPVECVSWNDCQIFISKLNEVTGNKFRLPTEAEWEFAAHGGNDSHNYNYSGSNNLSNVAWFDDNSGEETHEVATKKSNELGIYDMSGNVWEWCSDWFGDYRSSDQLNPQGPMYGKRKVVRGGDYGSYSTLCKVRLRFASQLPDKRGKNIGLRLVLSA